MDSLSTLDKKEFWNKKILPWEKKNYHGGPLWGSAIRWRQRLFLGVAEKSLKGAQVFEAGCGSGLLLEELFAAGIKSYVGCDISPSGIREAKARALQLGVASKTDFHEKSVLEMKDVQTDLFFSLGLWDWLTDEEIDQSLKLVKANRVLHSFSEKRTSLSQMFHRVYVYTAYGHNNMSYTPRYRSLLQVTEALRNTGFQNPVVYRNRRMSFSSFAHNLEK